MNIEDLMKHIAIIPDYRQAWKLSTSYQQPGCPVWHSASLFPPISVGPEGEQGHYNSLQDRIPMQSMWRTHWSVGTSR